MKRKKYENLEYQKMTHPNIQGWRTRPPSWTTCTWTPWPSTPSGYDSSSTTSTSTRSTTSRSASASTWGPLWPAWLAPRSRNTTSGATPWMWPAEWNQPACGTAFRFQRPRGICCPSTFRLRAVAALRSRVAERWIHISYAPLEKSPIQSMRSDVNSIKIWPWLGLGSNRHVSLYGIADAA